MATDFGETQTYSAEQRLAHEADQILSNVGLSMDKLGEKRKILDLGAGICLVERAARAFGLRNVVSAGLHMPREIKDSGLDFVEMDARNPWQFERGVFDLIISRKGPLFHTRTKDEAVLILEEALRVLDQTGEIRINPWRFGFVKNEMFRKYPRFSDLDGQVRYKRSFRQQEEWIKYSMEANTETVDRLRSLGYEFNTIISENTSEPIENTGYLIFTK